MTLRSYCIICQKETEYRNKVWLHVDSNLVDVYKCPQCGVKQSRGNGQCEKCKVNLIEDHKLVDDESRQHII